jgi:hypothetical protein
MLPAMAQREPLSVCQLVNSARLQQEVTVRGFIAGGYHGYFLIEGIGKETCPGWPKRFFTSPALAGLAFFSSPGVPLTKEEEQLNLDLLRRLGALRGRGSLQPYRVTIRGVLVRRPSWLFTFRRANGTWGCFAGAYDGDCLGVFAIRSILAEGN